ncbi:MAG: PDZ domain-containing protein [Armatimonadetes bacterium]|nr:PDZ domain-containing protein [Armatimonadota bacterium]
MAMISALLVAGLLSAPLTKTIDVPFSVTDDALIVDAVLNGKKTSYMFDTGFSGTIVLDSPIDIGKPDGTITLRDFVGEFQAETVKIKSLKLGDLEVDAVGKTVVKQPSNRISEQYNHRCDGIMGLEVVSKYVTEINFQNKKFIFHPDSYDISSKVPDNKTTFLAKMLPLGNTSIELSVETLAGKSMVLALDTGNAFYGTTHKDVLERVGIWTPGKQPEFMKMAGVASGAVESFYMMMPEMKIFGVPVKQSVWSIIDLPSSSADHDGTIGFGFLKNFNITIDLKRRRVWLEKFTEEVGNQPEAEVGLSGAYDDQTDRILVYYVTPKGPADKAGIKRGDQILGIDGEDPGQINFRDLMKMMQGPKGSVVDLAISRDGTLMRIKVTRDFMINGMK